MKYSQFLIFLGLLILKEIFHIIVKVDFFFFMSFIFKGIFYVKLKSKKFLDCHSDGKNLEDMCSFGRDLILKIQFLFLFKQYRF